MQNKQVLLLADFFGTLFRSDDLEKTSSVIIEQMLKIVPSKEVTFIRKDPEEDMYSYYKKIDDGVIEKKLIKREELGRESFFMYCKKVYVFDEDEYFIAIPTKYQGENIGVLIFEDIERKPNEDINTNILEFYGYLCGLIIKNGILIEKSKAEREITLKQNIKMNNELKLAQKIQKSILPSGYEKYGEYLFYKDNKEAYYLGGDFYDIFKCKNGKVVFYLADVSGHGVAAALITVYLREAIRNISRRFGNRDFKPKELLFNLQKSFFEIKLEEDMYIGVLLGVLDVNTGKIIISNAGHNVPVLYIKSEEEEYEFFEMPGLPINHWFDDENLYDYNETEIEFERGDQIIFMTDGAIEAKSSSGEEMGQPRVYSHLFDMRDYDMDRQFESLCSELFKHIKNDTLEDDIAFLGLRRS